MGVSSESEAVAASIQLTPNSEIWIYSDAAIEINDAAGNAMGVAGMRDAIALVRASGDQDRPTTSMRQLLASFSGKERFDDDLSLMVLRWAGRADG